VDDINPFEQVIVYQPTDQWYEVKVVASQIITPHPTTQGQPFALVVTGKFTKTAELYPGATPIVQPNPGQKVILGKKNRWVMLGQQFGATGNVVTLTCQGAAIQGVAVTTATATSLTVETTVEGWTCPGGVILGTVNANGFESAPV